MGGGDSLVALFYPRFDVLTNLPCRARVGRCRRASVAWNAATASRNKTLFLTAVVRPDKRPKVLQRYLHCDGGGGAEIPRFRQQPLLSPLSGCCCKSMHGWRCPPLPTSAFDKVSQVDMKDATEAHTPETRTYLSSRCP